MIDSVLGNTLQLGSWHYGTIDKRCTLMNVCRQRRVLNRWLEITIYQKIINSPAKKTLGWLARVLLTHGWFARGVLTRGWLARDWVVLAYGSPLWVGIQVRRSGPSLRHFNSRHSTPRNWQNMNSTCSAVRQFWKIICPNCMATGVPEYVETWWHVLGVELRQECVTQHCLLDSPGPCSVYKRTVLKCF